MKVIDYSFDKRGWGHNFTLTKKLKEDGSLWEIIGHCRNIYKKDILFMGLKADGTDNVIYQVLAVDYYSNPTDMYKATIKWIPIKKMSKKIRKLLKNNISDNEGTAKL